MLLNILFDWITKRLNLESLKKKKSITENHRLQDLSIRLKNTVNSFLKSTLKTGFDNKANSATESHCSTFNSGANCTSHKKHHGKIPLFLDSLGIPNTLHQDVNWFSVAFIRIATPPLYSLKIQKLSLWPSRTAGFKHHYLKGLIKSFQLNCEKFNLLRDSTTVSDTAPGN